MATLSLRAEGAARVRAEGPIPLDEATQHFSLPGGNSPAPGTLKRWIADGKRGVRLDGAKVRGQLCTSLAAIMRFRDAVGLAFALGGFKVMLASRWMAGCRELMF